tara:strand:+ start:1978 stop:2511 length:534 start_codon:yes stop_codon:yes gene_type:complete
MSRVANNPIKIPEGVTISLLDNEISVKGSKGSLSMVINEHVDVEQVEDSLKFSAGNRSSFSNAMSGTTRALVNNMVLGVSQGFEKKLELVGVGFRAQMQGKKINLSLGFSHPVVFELPEEVTAETPSQTEIILKSNDKQKLGQVCAEIRALRPPEPYKGKGVRVSGEHIRRKEAKKK